MKGSKGSRSPAIECVWPARAVLGESPCWDNRSSRLVWLDIKGAQLHAYRLADAGTQSWELPCRMCSLDVPCISWHPPASLRGDLFIGCGDRGLVWIGLAGNTTKVIPVVHPERDRPENRFNDGKMGPDGRYWAGTMHDAEELTTGSLYTFRPDGSYRVQDHGYRVANGPAFSPDRSIVYHSDSARQEIYMFDLGSDGQLANKQVLVRFADGEGYPDGMTTDRAGNLWVAMWDGGRLEHVSPAGKRLGVIPLPTKRPTSCVFTDVGCSEMFVTSASIGTGSSDRLAGGLFRISFD